MALYIDDLIKEKHKQFNSKYSDFYNLSDNWHYSLYKIGKSNKDFIPKKGDIFLIQPIKGLYFYGKVLDIYTEGKSAKDYFACSIIFNSKTTKISIDDFTENYNDVIGVVEKISLISSLFFQNGKIVVVGNTNIDNSVKYGFLEQVGWRKIDTNVIDEKSIVKDDKLAYKYPNDYKPVCIYVNNDGEELDYIPDFYCYFLAYITESGLLTLFYKEYYIDNELFNFNNFNFNVKNLYLKKTIKRKKDNEILPFNYKKLKNKCHSVSLDVVEYEHLFEDYFILGNGYDIEKIFLYFLEENKFDSYVITTDSEAETFVVLCDCKEYLLDVIVKFKKYIEDEHNLSNVIKMLDFDE